jgi:hypothetical protein
MIRTRTGLLIIRVWIEYGTLSPLRAQIRLTTDVSGGFERRLTVAHEKAVGEAVQAWLSEMLDDARAMNGDHEGPQVPRTGRRRLGR